MKDPLETLSDVAAKLLAEWALVVTSLGEAEPDQVSVSAQFLIGNVKAEMTLAVLETADGQKMTHEVIENLIQKQRDKEAKK